MWQTAITLLIVAAVSVYLIRYYSRAYRSRSSGCSSCAGCCPERGHDAMIAGTVDCECPTPLHEQIPADRRSDQE